MDDDVTAENHAGEGVEPADDEMDAAGGGAEGGQVRFLGLVMQPQDGGKRRRWSRPVSFLDNRAEKVNYKSRRWGRQASVRRCLGEASPKSRNSPKIHRPITRPKRISEEPE